MKFNEENCLQFSAYDIKKPIIYFLIKDSEVVYVGKSLRGLLRPFEHTDKDFDKIAMLNCNTEDVDMLENKYILKYQPIYNKMLNNNIVISFDNAKLKLNAVGYKVSQKQILRRLKELKADYYTFNGKNFMNITDYNRLLLKLMEN